MKYLGLALLAATMLASVSPARAHDDPLTKPIVGKYTDKWMAPQAPVKIYGNTYFVGFAGLTVALIKTDAGLVLVDGGLPQGAPVVEENIRKLGFRPEDVKYILNTEVHYDHAGALAALSRDTGATVLTSAPGVQALRAGKSGPDDPQFGELFDIPAVKKLRAVRDGETIKLGKTTITAHATPGHTPGSTTWTWQSCEGDKCLNTVFVSSMTPISNDTYRFSGAAEPIYRKSIETIRNLPCDVLITGHPEQSGGDEKLELVAKEPNAFVDPNACRDYAAKYEKMFEERLAKERAR